MLRNSLASIRQWRISLFVTPSVVLLVGAGSFLGIFQLLEGAVRDAFFRLRPQEEREEAIVVVTIDEMDLTKIGDWPIPDRILAELITKLSAHQPQVIGLNILRNLPEEPGHQELLEVFRSTPNLIGVESVLGDRIGPPPILEDRGQVALVNVILDRDRHIRRGFLSMRDEQEGGKNKESLAVRTALKYLEAHNIALEAVNAKQLKFKLGEAIFTPLERGEAGYTENLGGYQILMNWRGEQSSFEVISMFDILTGNFKDEQVRDRLVLIGSVAHSTNDFFSTPYRNSAQGMAGVFVHANLASQIIRSALEGRPMLKGTSRLGELFWILIGSTIGAAGTLWLESTGQKQRQHQFLGLRTLVGGLGAGSLLFISAYCAFLVGTLLPVISPLVALAVSAIITTNLYKQWQLESANASLAIANQQLEEYSRTLEKKVEERTAELADSNKQLAKAKDVADAANAAKSEFLSNMSHELRTPLNGVLGYAQILKKSENLTAGQQKGINIISQCGSHLLTLINDLLDLSKIEARKLELDPSDCHLPSFLTGVAEICSIKAQQKNIAFTLNQTENLPFHISTDQKRLRQVLLNLLGNAIKFTDRGSVTLNIERVGNEEAPIPPEQGSSTQVHDGVIQPQPATVTLRFQIQDTGVGMTPEQLNKIFLPFEQVGEQSRKAEGTGLGLAISQKIVNLMGSQLQVSSELGQGSLFKFDLEVPLVGDSQSNQTISSLERKIVGIQDLEPTILVVDDYLRNREVLIDLLSPLGFVVVEAKNGEEGFKKAAEVQPDLIITNLIMPVMDGFEMIRKLRNHNSFKNIPVIVSSANVFESDRQKSLQAGGNEFLSKPVSVDKLLELLKKYLQLEWVYNNSSSQESELSRQSSSREMTVPSQEKLEELLHLAMMGHLQGIEDTITQLQDQDSQYSGFVEHVRTLADSFKIKQIREFLKSCL